MVEDFRRLFFRILSLLVLLSLPAQGLNLRSGRQSPAGLPGPTTPPPPAPKPASAPVERRKPREPVVVHFRLVKSDNPLNADESYTEKPLIDLPPVAVVEDIAEELPGEQVLYQQLDAVEAANGGASETDSQQVPQLIAAMNVLASDPKTQTICETGFNAGRGSLRWLLHSSPTTKVFSFDLGAHAYAPQAAQFLFSKFPGRILVTWGDSRATVPTFAQQYPQVKCDLIYLDGGHDPLAALADLDNFQYLANPTHNMVMIADTPCSSAFCQGPSAAWQKMVQSGRITPMDAEMVPGGARGFTIGRYNFAGIAVDMGVTTTPLPPGSFR